MSSYAGKRAQSPEKLPGKRDILDGNMRLVTNILRDR